MLMLAAAVCSFLSRWPPFSTLLPHLGIVGQVKFDVAHNHALQGQTAMPVLWGKLLPRLDDCCLPPVRLPSI